MNTRILFLFMFLSLISFTACDNGSGKGGTSTIRGKVWVREYNKDFTIQKTPDYPAQELRVYLIYGDDDVYSDDFRTDNNGEYEFKYLREGKYTVFVYSKDSTLDYNYTNQLKAISREVEITDKNQTVEVPDMLILN
jgi:hypothetical protein